VLAAGLIPYGSSGHPSEHARELLGYQVGHENWPNWIDEVVSEVERAVEGR
jgi:hypothetical protein